MEIIPKGSDLVSASKYVIYGASSNTMVCLNLLYKDKTILLIPS